MSRAATTRSPTTTRRCPRGAGAGPVLARAEQIDEQVGPIGWMGYILAATMNPADAKGFEELCFDGLTTIMTFALMPVTVQGRTVDAPVWTGG
jgi:hypothetical protein